MPRKGRDTPGICVLGNGYVGAAHLGAYVAIPRSFSSGPVPRLVAVFGRNKKRAMDSAEKYGGASYFTDWHRAIAHPDVDVVDNCLPNSLHMSPILEAAEAGKDLLCEKPLGMNSAEAERMVMAAKRAHVRSMVGFNYRFLPAVKLAKELIDDRKIGRIQEFSAVYQQDWLVDPMWPLEWRLKKELAGSGAIGDLGSHVVDLARFLVGDIESTVALSRTFVDSRPVRVGSMAKGEVDVDDMFVALLRFHGGVVGSIRASRYCPGSQNQIRIEVYGTEGALSFDAKDVDRLSVCSANGGKGFKIMPATESVEPCAGCLPAGHQPVWDHTFVHEIHHFLNAVAQDRPIEPWGATFTDGLRVNQVLDAIVQSSSTGKWEKAF